jgi:hypothetical protein
METVIASALILQLHSLHPLLVIGCKGTVGALGGGLGNGLVGLSDVDRI